MQIINNPSQDEIMKAAHALRNGHLVAFPTETVYGLGADATNENAVSNIYTVKGRPTNHPLIVHIASLNQLGQWAIDIPEYAIKLAQEFWPGPLTLILKKSALAKKFITGGQNNIGIRIPSHPIAIELLKQFENLGGVGVAAPSANRFGAVSPTNAEAVVHELSNHLKFNDQILDGGQSKVGIESTIIDCTIFNPVILRPGAVTIEMIEKFIKISAKSNLDKNIIRTSGLLTKHYSPKAKVVMGTVAAPGDGFIALAEIKTPTGALRLAAPETIAEFAMVLYESLRTGDKMGLSNIVVFCPSGEGLELAIRDRLAKAAAE
jgi:L-threonylcarbamoyladenylate synthase